jgi:inosine/xanthosine triphosphate pyrophosphatase family protein/ADP-ribose pyrophosphatase YjhB (NUDIX family)
VAGVTTTGIALTAESARPDIIRNRRRTRRYGEYARLVRLLALHAKYALPHEKALLPRMNLADFPIRTETLPVQRVRAVLITPAGRLLAIRRTEPGQDPYWMLPGGGIEPADVSLEHAVLREIREEVGGHATLHRLIHIATVAGHAHAIFLGHIDFWDPAARSGPELAEPANGRYDIDELSLDPDTLADGWLWPAPAAQFVADTLRHNRDLFTLPDLRDNNPIRWRSRRVPQPYDGPIAMVTGSQAKFAIARDHLAQHNLAVEHVHQDLTEIQSLDVAVVARHKAEQAYAQLGRPLIVEDSSFGLDELRGFPGALVKHLIDAGGARAMAHLADLTDSRMCTSTAALVYADADGLVTFTHSHSGGVATQPAGHAGDLPLWTVYIPPGSAAPLAAMPEADRDTWHGQWQRDSVFSQFARWYTHTHTDTMDAE